MLTYIDKKYSSIAGRGVVSRALRFIFRVLANIVLPVYFRLISYKQSKPSERLTSRKVVVSMTSFPDRISKLWLVIECIIRQTYPPDKILLYLSITQFPNKENDLPKSLLKYQKANALEIIFVDDDLRSHKKYYYSFQQFPDDIIILVDDDIFYVKTLIKELILLHLKYPNCICCHRAYRVKKNKDSQLKPYGKWRLIKTFMEPSFNLFHTSGGGTLYIPSFYSNEVLNSNIFKKICFYADDIWLNFHAQRCNIATVKSGYYSDLLPVLRFKDISLKSFNVADGGNDRQLQDLMLYYNSDGRKLFNMSIK